MCTYTLYVTHVPAGELELSEVPSHGTSTLPVSQVPAVELELSGSLHTEPQRCTIYICITFSTRLLRFLLYSFIILSLDLTIL